VRKSIKIHHKAYNNNEDHESRQKKGLQSFAIDCNPFELLEAATGVEPVNNGFADRCLSHLAMPPKKPNTKSDRINRIDRKGKSSKPEAESV
jgi:hypothetical protein